MKKRGALANLFRKIMSDKKAENPRNRIKKKKSKRKISKKIDKNKNKNKKIHYISKKKRQKILKKLAKKMPEKKMQKKGGRKLKKIKKAEKAKKSPKKIEKIKKIKKTSPVKTFPIKNMLKKMKKFSHIKKKKEKKKTEFFKLNIPGFDNLISPGVPAGTSNLVEGGPGSGKTIFCLNVGMNACKNGRKVLYMSFEEPEEKLRSHLKNFGLKPEEYEKKGLLYIKRFNALDIARSVEALLSEAKKELLIDVQPVLIPSEFKPDIVLIDSLSSIASAFSGEENRFRIYMEQLFRYLESHEITSFLIRETGNPTHVGATFIEKGEAVSFLSDGIIALYNVLFENSKRGRGLEIIKMRGVDVKRKIVECEITKKGFVVYPERVVKGNYRLT